MRRPGARRVREPDGLRESRQTTTTGSPLRPAQEIESHCLLGVDCPPLPLGFPMARKPDSLPWWEVTPERFPRSLLGTRFRWPVWWEWVLILIWYVLAFRTGWFWLVPTLWPLLLLRQGALLSYQTPLRSAAVALGVLMAVNLVTLAVLLAGTAFLMSVF